LRSNQPAEALPADFAEALDRAGNRLGRLASRVSFFSSAGSTNDIASSLAAGDDCEGVLVVADSQTAGRGRRGHTWLSPQGTGLYVSVVLMPARARHEPDRATALTTIAAGVALAEGIEASTGLRVDLKWPNDLYAARRKLGGILAEGVPGGSPDRRAPADAVIVGYGINVQAMDFPPELAMRATSLEMELGRPVDRALVFAETLAALARRYEDLLDGRFDAILDAWRAHAPGGRGARVSWTTPSGTQNGVTAGVDDRGALLVDVGGRLERIVAGELTWL
jgi:BirA family biotin operon repressor/biotin-[acetyl-CoA-carboxylase] ligase